MMPPPISALTTTYASAPHRLQSLHSHAALKRYASNTALNPPYASAPPQLTILRLTYYIHSVRWLVGLHNQCNQGNILSGFLFQQDVRGNC
ncbi:hypothetical protein O181_114340 [Austropuccinia psidii MF-1]|uniref:Uncharacterized protein n=1 Tax=Austropuccinia psidii MF-1 TaxID=1389203 RepID=A0A9Q3PVE3_9BASI|nr:hypothetical protein [Austropuccinia psidii MF-1]